MTESVVMQSNFQRFSALWGTDSASDFVRYAKAYRRAKINAGLLLVPTHPVFNCNGLKTHDFRHLTPSKPVINNELSCYQSLIDYYLPKSPFNSWRHRLNSAQTLVLQIDNAYSPLDDGQHPPAPLIYYQYILQTRYWKKVILIDGGQSLSPVSQKLLAIYPRIQHFKGNTTMAWLLISKASNLVVGAGALSQILALHSNHKKRVWVPSYAKSAEFITTDKRTVLPLEINHYFSNQQWQSRLQQHQQLLNHPVAKLVDNNRWLFYETERCRSFEFCQSCRDLGSAGKLWRATVQQRFEVPERDWQCPYGWRWGGQPNILLRIKKRFKIGTLIKKTTTALGVKPCTNCEHRAQYLDGGRR